MEMKVIASTKVGYIMPANEALEFGAKSAGICYMGDSFDEIMKENESKTQKRINQTLNSGHHSVYGHPTYNILFTNIPKIIAMVLNNEGIYTTSEKSARYTKMSPSQRELDLYTKWLEIFKEVIKSTYDDIPEIQIGKLAQENARYMIGVFTPTTMEYTVSLVQLNYIVDMMKRFIIEKEDNRFFKQIKEAMKEFICSISEFVIEELNCAQKCKNLSLFDVKAKREEYFGDTYSTSYKGSFAQLAQAQRHRTLNYKMSFDENNMEFYVPVIIAGTEYEDIWLNDIQSVADIFPQGTLIHINERGICENFMLKCTERLCGFAQLEIMKQTISTLENYANYDAGDILYTEYFDKGYGITPRCRFPGWKCTSPCMWGPKEAFYRKI